MKSEKAENKATGKCLFGIWNESITNRHSTLYEILLGTNFAYMEQVGKHYYKMNLQTHLDAVGDDNFFRAIIRAY